MTQELQVDNQEIIGKYNSGKSLRQIASDYKSCHKTIKRVLLRNGIVIRPKTILFSIDSIKDLYINKRKSIKEMSRIFNVHHNVIKKNLIHYNISMRNHKEQISIAYQTCPNLLNKLNNIKDGIERDPKFFYTLGAFKGDGYYNIKKSIIKISVTDFDFLEEIKRIFNVLSPETRMEIKVSKEETITTKKLYRLNIGSRDFFNKGLHTLIPQTTQEKVFYLKGLYDAEGSIEKNKCAITLAQKNIDNLNLWISWLNEIGIQTSTSTLNRIVNQKDYSWSVVRILGKESKIKFYNLIGFRIKRKQERLEEGIKKLMSNVGRGG
jgi:hypothetical protein